MLGDKPILNDWLAAEFRTRISKKRKLLLTDHLSTALKWASIQVTAKEVAAEQKLISARRVKKPIRVKLVEALQRSLDDVHGQGEAYEQYDEPDPDDLFEPDDPNEYQYLDDSDDYDEPDPDDIHEPDWVEDDPSYHLDGPTDDGPDDESQYDGPTDESPNEGPPDEGPNDES